MNNERENLLAKCRREHDAGSPLEPGEKLALMHANTQALRALADIGKDATR